MNHYQFDVKMACSGCSNAVTKALNKIDGVDKVETNLEKQTVDVTANGIDYDTVLEKIKNTGKVVNGGRVIA